MEINPIGTILLPNWITVSGYIFGTIGTPNLVMLTDTAVTITGDLVLSGTVDGVDIASWIDQDVSSGANVNFGTIGCGAITATGNIIIPNNGYIGSVGTNQAIQIEADGDVVLSKDLTILGGSTISGGILLINKNNSPNFIELGQIISNQFAILDLKGDSTYTDYGVRLIRYNSGANADSRLTHRGTGPLYLVAEDAGSLIFQTANTTRMTVTPTGSVIVAKAISSATAILTASSDDYDVSGINTLFIAPAAAPVVLGGLKGGVLGQVLYIAITGIAFTTTIENVEGVGTQDIYLCDESDDTLDDYGGWVLICDGTNWYDCSHAKHI